MFAARLTNRAVRAASNRSSAFGPAAPLRASLSGRRVGPSHANAPICHNARTPPPRQRAQVPTGGDHPSRASRCGGQLQRNGSHVCGLLPESIWRPTPASVAAEAAKGCGGSPKRGSVLGGQLQRFVMQHQIRFSQLRRDLRCALPAIARSYPALPTSFRQNVRAFWISGAPSQS